MMHQNGFPESLIKGRIAETIFELMFREGTDFDIFPLGYEHIAPSLRQYYDHPENQLHHQHKETVKRVLNNINNIPDYFLSKPDKSQIYFVEVKYLATYKDADVLKIANEINEKWSPAWLFLASNDGFHFDSCGEIIKNNGVIRELHWIDKEIQKYYLNLLTKFEH